MNESSFRNWVGKHWRGWLSRYEPRKGSTIGIADLQVVVDGLIIPIELKIGHVELGTLSIERIRPVQIHWHNQLAAHGAYSCFVVGVGRTNERVPVRAFVFDGGNVRKYTKPFHHSLVHELDVEHFDKSLKDFLRNRIASMRS